MLEKHHVMITGIVLAVGGYWYWTMEKYKKPTIGAVKTNDGQYQPDLSAVSKNYKGYSAMMKIPPEYYNNTSMENNAGATFAFNPGSKIGSEDSGSMQVPGDSWVLPAEQGNGMMVSAGWTAISDHYAAKVSNAWLQQEAQGAHL